MVIFISKLQENLVTFYIRIKEKRDLRQKRKNLVICFWRSLVWLEGRCMNQLKWH